MKILDVHGYLGPTIVPGAAASAAVVTSTMSARGVGGAVLMSRHAQNVDPIAGNRIVKAMVEQAPNLLACLVTHIGRVDASIEAMRELLGGRKFVAMAITGFRPGHTVEKMLADDILNAFRRFTKPLMLFTPNSESVHAAVEIAKSYPMIKVVLLGMGGAEWRTAIAAAQAVTNIYLETSGALDRAKIPSAVEAIGTNRIVFGSGTPHVDVSAALGLIEDSAISEEARRKILFDNAVRLFGLGGD